MADGERLARIGRKLRTAVRMRGRDRALLIEAAASLLAARLRTRFLPFRTLAQQLGGLVPPPPAGAGEPACTTLPPDQADAARAIRWAIAATSPWLPFRTVCLQQAVAARAMLARRGIGSVLHLGVSGAAARKLDAHAWLEAGQIKVTGYPVDPALAEVGRFV